jgi:hypothetical protein
MPLTASECQMCVMLISCNVNRSCQQVSAMPLLNGLPVHFPGLVKPCTLADEDKVWYIRPLAQAVRSFDDYASCLRQLNSKNFTCYITLTTGLSFTTALNSEARSIVGTLQARSRRALNVVAALFVDFPRIAFDVKQP